MGSKKESDHDLLIVTIDEMQVIKEDLSALTEIVNNITSILNEMREKENETKLKELKEASSDITINIRISANGQKSKRMLSGICSMIMKNAAETGISTRSLNRSCVNYGRLSNLSASYCSHASCACKIKGAMIV